MNFVDWLQNGGFPELLDDLDFDQKAVREAISGFASGFGVGEDQSFILSGCVLSSGAYGAGFICLNGEVLRFDGVTAPTVPVGSAAVWGVLETNDANGTKTMENATIREAYKVRRAKIEVVTIAQATGRFWVTPRVTIGTKIAKMVELQLEFAPNKAPDWKTVGATGNIPFYNNGGTVAWGHAFGAGICPAQYRLWPSGLVELRGIIQGSGVSSFFILPPGYRPPTNRESVFTCANPHTTDNYNVWVDDDGTVFLYVNPGGTVKIDLSAIRFYTT